MRSIPAIGQDFRYAVRGFRRAPVFTAVAVATLALGIGATTAIFTVVDGVLLRPLRFPEPQQLIVVRPSSGSRLSHGYLDEWRRQSGALRDMAGWHDVRANVTGQGEPFEALADRTTSNFFALLGVPAALGRTFTITADLGRVEPEVVLSHGFWQRRYGGDPGVVGRSITLDGEPRMIVGVMPQGIAIRTTELSQSRAELWMPFALIPEHRTGMGGILHVVGRLAPEASIEQAQTELALIARRIEEAHPSYSRAWSAEVVPLLEATVRDARLTLLVLFGTVGLLLLIASANVANLVLSRSASRHTELTIRLAIGATRGRLVRQSLTESLTLAMAGGALGVLLAAWGTGLLTSAIPPGVELPRLGEIGFDVRVLGFAALVTIATAVIFGVVPALRSAGSASITVREATRGVSPGPGRHRAASLLMVAQMALTLVVLTGAGLLGRSFWELTRVNPGFHAGHVLTMRTTLPAAAYDSDERVRSFSRNLLDRVAQAPGVVAVGSANYLPMSLYGAGGPFEIEGRPAARADDRPGSWLSVVGGRYFEAMGIPLVRGRLPGPADTEHTSPIVVIDETLAARYWPAGDPIGARLVWTRGTGEAFTTEIVGIVGVVRWGGLATDPQPTTYFWFPQRPGRDLTLVVRTAGDPVGMAGTVAAQVALVDPQQPVADVRPLQDLVDADLARPRFTMLLVGGFGAAALLLTALGLYGVIAFWVAERTQEIGVRVALGAGSREVLGMVMRRGLRLVAVGLGIGVMAALGMSQLVSGLLYGIEPTNAATLIGVSMFLAAVAALATYIPARHATRVDPIVALRAE